MTANGLQHLFTYRVQVVTKPGTTFVGWLKQIRFSDDCVEIEPLSEDEFIAYGCARGEVKMNGVDALDLNSVFYAHRLVPQ